MHASTGENCFKVRKLWLLSLAFVVATQAILILAFVSIKYVFLAQAYLVHASVIPRANVSFVPMISMEDPPPEKSKLLLLLVVSTAPHRRARREAIRGTWWKRCKRYKQIKCVFFTDGDIEDRELRLNLVNEQAEYRDILFQPFSGGGSFGRRFLHHITWAHSNYEYDFFMRLDDDMMLCVDRLVLDLSQAPKSSLIWSWFHCQASIVRPEESFIIISHDVVEKFVNQNKTTMLCHALADQQVALWAQDQQLTGSYYSDGRIHHHPPASHVMQSLKAPWICHNYIALHGVYDRDMFTLWANRGPTTNYPKLSLPQLSEVCSEEPSFDWQAFSSMYRYEPKLCLESPTWDMSEIMEGATEFFKGREG